MSQPRRPLDRSASLGVLLALALLIPAAADATPGPEALKRATRAYQLGNTAYGRSEYEKAAELYRKAVDEGVADPRLYYNYANSLFRLQRLGMAILYYEKARKLAPHDEDIAFNLRFASARTIDKVPTPEENLLTRILWAVHSSFTINQGLWVTLGLFAGLCLAATLALFTGPALRSALMGVMALAALVLLVLAPSLVYKITRHEGLAHAVVLTPALEMYSGPGDNYQLLTKVHEGTRLEIVEMHGEWASVKLANGKGGYVRLADLGKV